MSFWDSSALVQLLVKQPRTKALHSYIKQQPRIVAWWGSIIECASAIARLEREEKINSKLARGAIERARELRRRWIEILPSEEVIGNALRLVRVHSLRAGDSLQLAAAMVANDRTVKQLEFVCYDDRLKIAAEKEGFSIVAP